MNAETAAGAAIGVAAVVAAPAVIETAPTLVEKLAPAVEMATSGNLSMAGASAVMAVAGGAFARFRAWRANR